jgi:hypothetical protein
MGLICHETKKLDQYNDGWRWEKITQVIPNNRDAADKVSSKRVTLRGEEEEEISSLSLLLVTFCGSVGAEFILIILIIMVA